MAVKEFAEALCAHLHDVSTLLHPELAAATPFEGVTRSWTDDGGDPERNALSRLAALKTVGSVPRVAQLARLRVAVFGAGAVGAHAAAALARCGVKKITVFDENRPLQLEHLAAGPWEAPQVGLARLQALRFVVGEQGDGVELETVTCDALDAGDRARATALLTGPRGRVYADAVLCCVGEPRARAAVGDLALALGVPLFACALARDCLTATVRFVMPGETACLRCAQEGEGEGEGEGEAEAEAETEVAVIPGVVLLAAGALGQTLLRFALEFGEVSPVVQIDAFGCATETRFAEPEPACPSAECQLRQAEVAAALEAARQEEEAARRAEEEAAAAADGGSHGLGHSLSTADIFAASLAESGSDVGSPTSSGRAVAPEVLALRVRGAS